jgi:FtsH-binding integral membrane protein
MESLKRWFSARSPLFKVVVILLALVLVFRVLQAMFANNFTMFVVSGLVVLALFVLDSVRAGSNREATAEQTLGRNGELVLGLAIVLTVVFGGVSLASAVVRIDRSKSLMSREFPWVAIGQSEVVAAHIMVRDNVPCVVITEAGRVAGMVTWMALYKAIVSSRPESGREGG